MLAPMGTAALQLLDVPVEPAWIDYNGHMNVGYYVVAFDRGTDELIDRLGMDAHYRERSGCTVFVLETHVTYLSELKLGDVARIDAQVLDHDPKRIHYVMTMRRARDGQVAATTEILLMHMDLASVRGAPMPADVLGRLERLAQAHRALPWPEAAGRRIGIRRR